jgi:hypothetical protein
MFLLKLDRINANHIGNPIDNVKIKCLDKLNVYGINPNRLIIIIEVKIGVINDPEPFNLKVKVRLICSKITDFNI